MRIFICGQKSFGMAVLKRLSEDGHEITGAATAPQSRLKDKMYGYAVLNNIPVVNDCERFTAADVPDGTELIISAHSHWMISDKAIGKCKYGGIGFHPSLLPRHRGQDAVRWAIHMGDYITGGTVYKLAQGCDTGDIVLQRVLWIDSAWDYHELWKRLFPVGVDLLSDAVRLIGSGRAVCEPQDEHFATWEPSWERPRLKRNDLIMIGGK